MGPLTSQLGNGHARYCPLLTDAQTHQGRGRASREMPERPVIVVSAEPRAPPRCKTHFPCCCGGHPGDTCAGRFSWDLGPVPITDRERAKLLSAGVCDEALHRYAIWRRSTLFVVLGPTLIAALLATAGTFGQDREG